MKVEMRFPSPRTCCDGGVLGPELMRCVARAMAVALDTQPSDLGGL